MNVITVAGIIGKSAEIRQTKAGEAVAGFSLADTQRTREGEKTIWYECSIWGRRGEALAQYLTKGTPVTVTGTFSPREYTGKDGAQRVSYDVRVTDVALQGKGWKDDAPRAQSVDKAQAWKAGANDGTGFDDEDLPF